MKIAFAGTPDFAVPTLKALLASRHEVCLVITQPDRPAGRNRQLAPPPVKQIALAHGATVIQPESINRPEAVEALRRAAPDLLVIIAYGKRLTSRVLKLPRMGCINLHASLLPAYRGAAPIAHAVLRGECHTGVTVQRVALAIDTGAVLAQREVEIGAEETAGDLTDRLAALAGEMVLPALDDIESGRAVEQPQDNALATEAPKLAKDHGRISWCCPARTVSCLVRAMTPWPGACTWHYPARGSAPRRITILAARPVEMAVSAPPGTVLRADQELVVATGEGAVCLLRVKPDGARAMDAAAWLRGHAVQVGDRFDAPECCP